MNNIMKKNLILVLSSIVIVLSVIGCSSKVNDYKETVWNMEYIQGKDGDVIYSSNENKDIYPNADIKRIYCTLEESSITITDEDTGKEWIGNLKIIDDRDSESIIYEVKFDNNETGYMTKSFTEYEDKTKVDTMIISNKEYLLNLTLN